MSRRPLGVLLLFSLLSTTVWIQFSTNIHHAKQIDQGYDKCNISCNTDVSCKQCHNGAHRENSISGSQENDQPSWANTYMELNVKARLCNQLFAYAALREFSAMKNSTPIVIPDHADIAAIFNIRRANYVDIDRSDFVKLPEMRRDLAGTLSEIENLKPANISFVGYYQSPRYFENIRAELREEYTFREPIARTARNFLKSVLPRSWRNHDHIQVAIHVRRTDHVSYKFTEKLGFNFPPESYFRLAMEYFASSHTRVQFVVGSDDLDWCKRFFASFHQNIVYSENHTAVEDLAILSYCDHAITTIGTYSWWVGWLCTGTTMYYAHYDRRPSWVSMVLHPSHYIPQDEYNNWIPIKHKDDRRQFNRTILTEDEWMEINNVTSIT